MTPAGPRLPVVSDRVLAVGTLIGLSVMFLYRISYVAVDPDLWHGMALARETIASGWVPMEDRFAYTPTIYPSVHHEWLAGLIAYLIAVTVGPTGIILAKYGLAFGLGIVCWTVARRSGAGVAVLGFLTPIAILLAEAGFSTIRAQIYSFLFCACLIYWFQRDRQGDRLWVILWCVLFVLWLNLHGGFLAGAGLFFVYWLEQWSRGRPHRHLLLAGIALVPLVALNPYGVRYYGYLWDAMTLPRPLVREWAPLWRVTEIHLTGLFLASLALLAYAVWDQGLKRTGGLPVVVVTALAAVISQRFLPFYAVAWLCLVPGYVQPTALGRKMDQVWTRRRRLLLGIWAAAVIVMVIRVFPLQPWRLRVPGYRIEAWHHVVYPVGAVRYLEEVGWRGNLYVSFEHGGYVMWKLHPAVKISMDGRYEAAYPSFLVDENYRFFMAQEGWRETLDAYPTDAVLIPRHLPVADEMPRVDGWVDVYRDDQFILYARTGSDLPRADQTGRRFEGTFP